MRPIVLALAALSLLSACQSEEVADEAQAAPNASEAAPLNSAAIPSENAIVPTASGTRAAESAAAAGTARKVRCRVAGSGTPPFEGECLFDADRGGSFALSRAGKMPLVDGIAMISVTVVAPGRAEVRGLTTAGINSRWGEAIRSETDPACWRGSDFEICAW